MALGTLEGGPSLILRESLGQGFEQERRHWDLHRDAQPVPPPGRQHRLPPDGGRVLPGRVFERTNCLVLGAKPCCGVAVCSAEQLYLSGLTCPTCTETHCPLTTALRPRTGGSRPSQRSQCHCIRRPSMRVVLGWRRGDLCVLFVAHFILP